MCIVVTEPLEEQAKSVKKPEEPESQSGTQKAGPEEKSVQSQSKTAETHEAVSNVTEKQSTKTLRAVSKISGPLKTRQKDSKSESEAERATKELPQFQDDPSDADYTPS